MDRQNGYHKKIKMHHYPLWGTSGLAIPQRKRLNFFPRTLIFKKTHEDFFTYRKKNSMSPETMTAERHSIKSTITCDMEGIIQTYNPGAQALFGYIPDEVIGKKRVSIFSPGWIVLQNVNTWLKKARVDGEHQTRTVFVRKDGSRFNAEIRITPTFHEGKQIGYCGVTTPIEEEVKPTQQWWIPLVIGLVVTRAPFLSASIIPAFLGAAFASNFIEGPVFSSLHFVLAALGVVLLQLAANVLNDYFDWTSGTDPANTQYFLKYSGGSRAIELGLITERGTKLLGFSSLAAAAAIGIFLWQQVGMGVLVFGLAGAFTGYFYSAPPFRFAARHGLGELVIAVTFGPLITGGMYYVLTSSYSAAALLVGVPIGLLTANILLINEVPDVESDAATGKKHLVVTLGKENAVIIYALTVTAAIAFSIFLALYLEKIWLLIPTGGGAVFAVSIILTFRRNLYRRELVSANVNTIFLANLYGILFTICLMV